MKANSVIFPLTNPSQPPDKGRRLATSARPCQKSQIRADFALSQRSSGECRVKRPGTDPRFLADVLHRGSVKAASGKAPFCSVQYSGAALFLLLV
jgi:hypothetical protein